MAKGSQETRISEAVADEARRWVIEFDAGDVSPEERARFMRWLNADPLHRQAYDELQNQWRQFDVVQQLRTDEVDSEVVGKWLRRRSLRRWTAPLAAAATIAAVAFGLWFTQTTPVYEAEYGTTVGQQRVITLPDESSMTLNTKSRVKIRYTDDKRRIELRQGEVHFDVARAPHRPFVVVAGAGTVRAVGTAFSVYMKDDSVEVTVTEGTVAVTPPATPTGETASVPVPAEDDKPAQMLTEGHKLRFKQDVVEVVGTVTVDEIERELAWRDGMLDFERAPLSDVIAEAGRYMRHELIIVDTELESLEFTGYFRAGDVNLLMRLLDSNDVIQTRRVDYNTVHIAKAGSLPQ